MVFRGNVTLTAPVQDSSTVTSKHSEASLDNCPERNLSAKRWYSGHRKALALSLLPVGDIVWLIMYEQQSMRTANQLRQLLVVSWNTGRTNGVLESYDAALHATQECNFYAQSVAASSLTGHKRTPGNY